MTEIDPDCIVMQRFIVPGEPVSKARPRFGVRRGRIVTYSDPAMVAAERKVAAAYRAAALPGPPHSGEVMLRATFYCGTRRRKDLDNMIKLVSDALNGVAYEDDSQVVSIAATVHRGEPDPRSDVWIIPLAPACEPEPIPAATKEAA
ncbi:RusA family crossover junction endodeoxyribonuclease [Mycobacteroides chelonae]|uniref:RusA family crossover junction endodeoxyribonuclease n=1 Tax=Mycobacteroides chelonae TaxID=1774 RepID=UPI000992445D|nr:RusA family crossover junction endodeoxyribonuclease [Mycobacteroides chelonae]